MLLPCALLATRLLYWLAADGAGRREAYDALAAAILCLGSSASSRWTAAAAVLRQAQQRGADDLPSARAAGGAEQQSLHRVTLSDEPGQLFLLSRWGPLLGGMAASSIYISDSKLARLMHTWRLAWPGPPPRARTGEVPNLGRGCLPLPLACCSTCFLACQQRRLCSA